MPLRVKEKMEQRLEWVKLTVNRELSLSEISKRAGVCRKTLYNWIRRYEQMGSEGLNDIPTTPGNSPSRTDSEIEALVVGKRNEHPRWGARKIRASLERDGHGELPAPSTVHRILERHGMVDAEGVAKKWKRFEMDAPNRMWQLDFKGHFAMKNGKRCHPMTVLDDHSRFALAIEACGDETGATVKSRLTKAFHNYGLPDSIITDNAPPWGVPIFPERFTLLGIWLIRNGIVLKKIRPYHPQTNGKLERFHRSLKAEVLQARNFADLDECCDAFNEWRHIYNFRRPHEAIEMKTPSERYKISPVPFKEKLPEIEYSPSDEVRKVQQGGIIDFRGKRFRVGTSLEGFHVALRPAEKDGVFEVYFVRQIISILNFRDAPLGGHPSEEHPSVQ